MTQSLDRVVMRIQRRVCSPIRSFHVHSSDSLILALYVCACKNDKYTMPHFLQRNAMQHRISTRTRILHVYAIKVVHPCPVPTPRYVM
ncbi:hypothetical protein VTL71DRAFT_15220 [Oculimacula yallundae]|uniref:Uncharacterized protein n=1 Tax=Oculimacula yallundae TaxID=86028 RepID=A0ABR4CH89_9HELO